MYLTCRKCNIPKRFIIVIMVFISCINIFYLHTNLSMAVVSMTSPKPGSNNFKPEFEWNSKQKGLILASINYGRLLGPLGAMLAGVLGGSTLFAISILLTALITLAIPFSLNINFYLFIVANASIGILDAFGICCLPQLWSQWAPPNERSKFISFSIVGCFIGSIISYLVSSYILKTYSWMILFYVSGIFGFVWFWIWYMVVSDGPQNDKCITEAERKYIIEQVKCVPTKKLFYPLKKIYTCRPFLTGCLAMLSLGCGGSFVIGYLPQYIKDISNLDIDKIGYISIIPMISAFISMPVFGCLLDYIRKKNVISLTNLHRWFGTTGLFLGGTVFLLLSIWPNFIGSIICISVYLFVSSIITIDLQILALDLAPRYAAFLHSNMSFFFTSACILTPTFIGFVVTDHSRLQWNFCFLTFSVLHFSAALGYLIYISGDLQPWANYKSEEIEME